MAELTRAYPKFQIPPVEAVDGIAEPDKVTLVEQFEGLSALLPAPRRRPARPHRRRKGSIRTLIGMYGNIRRAQRVHQIN